MARKKLTPEQEKEIKMLQASYQMLEKTRNEAKMKGNSSVDQIDDALNDTIEQIKKIDKKTAQDTLDGVLLKNSQEINYVDMTSVKNNTSSDVISLIEDSKKETDDTSFASESQNYDKSAVQYDVISLPSNGECYKNKVSRLPVGYLTAYDENLITSPNLYKDGVIIDFLVKQKVLKEDFNVDDLCAGDVDAITLFLRMTSYGTDFTVSVRDPETGKEFESVVDLSKIKYKEFKLKGDENGCFTYVLPLSKDEVKFKYLTRKQNKQLERLSALEDKTKIVTTLERNTNEILTALKNDDVLTDEEKNEITKYVDCVKKWGSKVNSQKNATLISKNLTNRIELEVQSINGNDDRQFIHNYIMNMRAKDSLELRRFINRNEPGVDFNITIERPEEFGGGSFNTFLEWDDAIFFNFS